MQLDNAYPVELSASGSGLPNVAQRGMNTAMNTPFQIVNLSPIEGTSLALISEKGGIVTSLKFLGRELLYQGMLDKTLSDTSTSVKGGIPILFPNAGPLTDAEMEASGWKLKQHGFARNNPWRFIGGADRQVIQTLRSITIDDTSGYPFNGSITNTITLSGANSCLFEYLIMNRGENPLPISFGLHPYFDVPMGNKADIQWNFAGGDQIAREIETWSNDGTTMLDVPADGKLNVVIPGVGHIKIEVSPDLKRLWIWSLPGRNFVCIEPVMGDEGAIVNSPVMVSPYGNHESSMRITLLES